MCVCVYERAREANTITSYFPKIVKIDIISQEEDAFYNSCFIRSSTRLKMQRPELYSEVLLLLLPKSILDLPRSSIKY